MTANDDADSAAESWRTRYIDLAKGVAMIRIAIEETIGGGIIPDNTQFQTMTALEECELIARAIYGLKPR